jgi:hypothetical protein
MCLLYTAANSLLEAFSKLPMEPACAGFATLPQMGRARRGCQTGALMYSKQRCMVGQASLPVFPASSDVLRFCMSGDVSSFSQTDSAEIRAGQQSLGGSDKPSEGFLVANRR